MMGKKKEEQIMQGLKYIYLTQTIIFEEAFVQK